MIQDVYYWLLYQTFGRHGWEEHEGYGFLQVKKDLIRIYFYSNLLDELLILVHLLNNLVKNISGLNCRVNLKHFEFVKPKF